MLGKYLPQEVAEIVLAFMGYDRSEYVEQNLMPAFVLALADFYDSDLNALLKKYGKYASQAVASYGKADQMQFVYRINPINPLEDLVSAISSPAPGRGPVIRVIHERLAHPAQSCCALEFLPTEISFREFDERIRAVQEHLAICHGHSYNCLEMAVTKAVQSSEGIERLDSVLKYAGRAPTNIFHIVSDQARYPSGMLIWLEENGYRCDILQRAHYASRYPEFGLYLQTHYECVAL